MINMDGTSLQERKNLIARAVSQREHEVTCQRCGEKFRTIIRHHLPDGRQHRWLCQPCFWNVYVITCCFECETEFIVSRYNRNRRQLCEACKYDRKQALGFVDEVGEIWGVKPSLLLTRMDEQDIAEDMRFLAEHGRLPQGMSVVSEKPISAFDAKRIYFNKRAQRLREETLKRERSEREEKQRKREEKYREEQEEAREHQDGEHQFARLIFSAALPGDRSALLRIQRFMVSRDWKPLEFKISRRLTYTLKAIPQGTLMLYIDGDPTCTSAPVDESLARRILSYA